MTSEALIRDICDDDVEQVVALWQFAGVSRPWNDPTRDIAFARRNTHSTILVAIFGDRVAATVMVGEDGHRGWVYYLATAPEHQGHGLGRAMMAAAENWLVKRRIWKINLLVREDNTGVREFYEQLGYRDTRTVCFQKVLEARPSCMSNCEGAGGD